MPMAMKTLVMRLQKYKWKTFLKKVAIKLMSNIARKLRLQYAENTLFTLYCATNFCKFILKTFDEYKMIFCKLA